MLWDKVGCRVELVVVRESNVKSIHLNMLVVEATPAEFNRSVTFFEDSGQKFDNTIATYNFASIHLRSHSLFQVAYRK